MENQNTTTEIRNEQFLKDLASEIGVPEIEVLPSEMSLSIPQLEAISQQDNYEK